MRCCWVAKRCVGLGSGEVAEEMWSVKRARLLSVKYRKVLLWS